MKTLNRSGRKKHEMRNLLKRGRKWYFKKMVDGKVKPVSLDTEDLELAKAKRNQFEAQALNKEWEKITGPRVKAGTLAEVFLRYRMIAGITQKAIRGNECALLCLVRGALENENLTAEDITLDMITRKLVRQYQEKTRAKYEAEAGTDEKARRSARYKADRTTKSNFNQAKSIFSIKRDMIERYREAEIAVPDCVRDFADARAEGKMSSKVYFPPNEQQMAQTFKDIETLREADPEAYFLFWAALGTGCRRNELADMKPTDIVEIEGRLWIGAGLGKDGEQIRIPVINFAVHPANPRTPASVLRELLQERAGADFLFKGEYRERYDEMPDRLNAWLARDPRCWNDEKKLHGIRGFIGSKLYSKNTHLARLYLRHKSIATTEKYYSAFFRLNEVFAFATEERPAPALKLLPDPVQTSGQAA